MQHYKRIAKKKLQKAFIKALEAEKKLILEESRQKKSRRNKKPMVRK